MGKRKKRLTMAKYATKYATIRERLASNKQIVQESEIPPAAEVLEKVTQPVVEEVPTPVVEQEEVVEPVEEAVVVEEPKPKPKRRRRSTRKKVEKTTI